MSKNFPSQPHGNQNRNYGSSSRNREEKPEKYPAAYDFAAKFDVTWVREQFSFESSQHAFDFAKYLAENDLTRTQVRNFFGELRRIEARGVEDNVEAIAHLKHKLAYICSRLKQDKLHTNVADTFFNVLVKGFDAMSLNLAALPDRFERFTAYFEAVLAYHRFHGGRES